MDVPRMSPEELQALRRSGAAVTLIDARRTERWNVATEQLPGALRIPPEQVADTLGGIPQRQVILIYCDSPGEATSAQVAENLMQRNFSGVFVLRGGFEAWVRAGLPTEARRPLPEEPPPAPL